MGRLRHSDSVLRAQLKAAPSVSDLIIGEHGTFLAVVPSKALEDKMTETATVVYSHEQIPILNWFESGSHHLVVRARAGTGKSFTIRAGVKLAPETSILIAAFSKNIQMDMESLMGPFPNGRIQTLHAVGYACIRRFRERIKVEFNSNRADTLADAVCGPRAPDAIKRLVSKLHTKGREIAPHATKIGDLAVIQIKFECEPDESWTAQGFDAAYVEQKALDAMELAATIQSGGTIDGSDMIFLPLRNGWLTKQFAAVVVDEAQDMTPAQLEIAMGVLFDGGRICIVGDDRQAIFGFRGADSDSLDRLKAELGAAELGLTTTRRCCQAVVRLAQTLVPDFEAHSENPEGEILELNTSKLVSAAGPGDFILSRVNAPLVSTAMQLLRAGKRARVAGRDIGAGLKALIRKLNAKSVPDLLRKIEVWSQREVARIEAQMAKVTNGRRAALQSKMEAVRDQADMLVSLSDGAKNAAEVTDRIEALFTDDGLGAAGMITCSSVHRAKGLEANRVFVLRDTLRDSNREEQNIAYVAYTRAKLSLVLVSDSARETA
jgi:ATP-dependent DNA helicase UvrD/PcrA